MDVPEEDTNSPGWVFKSEGVVCSPGERRVGRRGAAVSDRLGTAGQGRAAPAGGADTEWGARARWAMSRGVSPGQRWLGGCHLPVRCGWQGGGGLARRSAAPVGLPLQQVGFAVPALGPKFSPCPGSPGLPPSLSVCRADPPRRPQAQGPPCSPGQQGRGSPRPAGAWGPGRLGAGARARLL